MRIKLFVGPVLTLLLATAGCSDPSKDDSGQTGGTATDQVAPSDQSPQGAQPGELSAGGKTATTRPTGPSGGTSISSGSNAGARPGTTPTSAVVAASSTEWDEVDRNAPVPPDALRVVGGKTATGMIWRLYVYRDAEKRTCVQWYEKAAAGAGGPSARCDYKPPLAMSGSTSSDGCFVFGLTGGDAETVSVEHLEGQAETFATVGVNGFAQRFWGGEVGRTPLKRVVARDGGGKVVGTRDDMGGYCVTP